MHTIETHADFLMPAADVYAQWTQFEKMPEFLDHVEAVEQLDDRTLRLLLSTRRASEPMLAEITEQIPDKRIAWNSVVGTHRSSGCATFHRLSDLTSRVMLQVGLDAAVPATTVAVVRTLIEQELDHFRRYLERRGEPSGRWNGAVPSPDEREFLA